MNTTLHSFMNIFGTIDDTSSVQVRRIAIPPIQRDYAQGRNDEDAKRVRKRFLDSLYKAITETPITLDFIYGDVDGKGTMTPLDGQQRLTTLFLLHWYAAKKENVPKGRYTFLRSFSYETRYSARNFCEKLVEFTPSFEENLSEDIKNQEWFPLDWENDPTVSSMLVMLDAIDESFKNVPNIWNRLENNAITFYFLPIKDLGLTDELYIKMNSRGKPLTLFEHFKAELEKEMRKIDEQKGENLANRIAGKIDRDWTDLLWIYHDINTVDDDDTIDNRFLNYFRFVCDIICYRKGKSPQNHSNDVFDLIQDYFSVKNEDATANIETLESFFDCWCNINGYESPKEFLGSFMGKEHEPGKIITDSIDILGDCLNSYYDKSGSYRQFPLKRVVLLYAIAIYLQNQNKMAYSDFTRRIRIVNNLIQNSDNEISDRVEGSRIPTIVHAVDSIILEGVIDDSDNNFNSHQIKEEKEKAKFIAENPAHANEVFELEDHPMLNGQIGIIGLDHLDLGPRFASLFTCSWDKIDRAMMTIGNYCQKEGNGWRFQFASSGNQEAWKTLFHRSNNYIGFENTKEILIKLLEANERFDDRILDGIIDSFTTQCENNHTYPWTYYYVKYPAFRPGSYGKMGNFYPNDKYSPFKVEPYMFAAMQTPIRWSDRTYMPFLKEADDAHLKKYYGDQLNYRDVYIVCENDSFVVYKNEDDKNSLQETINIDQADGIDTTDRIILLKNYLKEHGLLDEDLSSST